MNDEMLALARGATAEFARNVGYDNVRFAKGRIQDLSLDRGEAGILGWTSSCGTTMRVPRRVPRQPRRTKTPSASAVVDQYPPPPVSPRPIAQVSALSLN